MYQNLRICTIAFYYLHIIMPNPISKKTFRYKPVAYLPVVAILYSTTPLIKVIQQNSHTLEAGQFIESINWPASSVWVFIAQAGRALQR